MTSKTITDRAGDTLRISTGSFTAGPGEVTIKVNEKFRGRESVAAVHVDPRDLRAALDEVAPGRDVLSPDQARSLVQERDEAKDMADLWKETARRAISDRDFERLTRDSYRSVSQKHYERAIAAERDRDDNVKSREEMINRLSVALEQARADAGQPRPLTADDITDEMVERGARQYIEEDYTSWERSPALAKNNARESVRGILEAALTEPAARPEGAEELADDLSGWDEMDDFGNRRFTHEELDDLADHLAARGWTKGEK